MNVLTFALAMASAAGAAVVAAFAAYSRRSAHGSPSEAPLETSLAAAQSQARQAAQVLTDAALAGGDAAAREALITVRGSIEVIEEQIRRTLDEVTGVTTEEFELPMKTAVAVAAEGVTRTYGAGATRVEALRGIDISVEKGEFVAVMGPSGSGKSTLLHILAGLDTPSSGRVSIGGHDLGDLTPPELTRLRRSQIGFIFQFFNLLPMLDAVENILLPLAIAGEKPDPAWLEELIHVTGLASKRTRRPAELSGGEQQLVAVARAVVTKPAVVLADEPTGNLDSAAGFRVLETLRNLVDSYGQTLVVVTHEARAAALADRVLFLADGLIVQELIAAKASDVEHVIGRIRSASEERSS